jgi:hypothetical protein
MSAMHLIRAKRAAHAAANNDHVASHHICAALSRLSEWVLTDMHISRTVLENGQCAATNQPLQNLSTQAPFDIALQIIEQQKRQQSCGDNGPASTFFYCISRHADDAGEMQIIVVAS